MLSVLDIQNLDIPAQSLMDIAVVCSMLQELKVTLNLNIGGDQTLGLAYSLDRYQSYQHQSDRTESSCTDEHRARVHERRSKIFAEDLAAACPRLHTLALRNSLASVDVKESSEVSQLARDLISALGARLLVLSVWKQLMFNSTMDQLASLRELYIPGTVWSTSSHLSSDVVLSYLERAATLKVFSGQWHLLDLEDVMTLQGFSANETIGVS
ncbi:hypothetical protein BGZ81_010331 [Podila clonocystis]|nr:hypothetical protein BGZ81_010331 [Podila clonocystis]